MSLVVSGVPIVLHGSIGDNDIQAEILNRARRAQ
jgi:hypothetical protein